MAADQPISKGQAWFCTSGLPSDIVVDVGHMAFHLHKFPLMSKSRKLHRFITEHETAFKEDDDDDYGDGEIGEAEPCRVTFPAFPGGSEAFEMAAKFCYGVKMDLTASNVVPLLCAAEFLEMTDDYCDHNLVSRTETFLSRSVLNSAKDSIRALRSCELLKPLSENLRIAQRCIESIASSADPGLFGWPVNDGAELASSLGIWNGKRGKTTPNSNPWFEDLVHLSVPLFKRLILAMRARDLSPETLESCLMCYAERNIPGVSRSSRKISSSIASEKDQRNLLENVITNLPSEKSSRSTTSTKLLFNLLRTANILNASEPCRAALEKRIGSQLDEASLDDLLIPSYSYLNETLYDVDSMERILGYFLDRIADRRGENVESLRRAGKLIDGYLSEIASDSSLKPDRFCNLAMALPEQARVLDDGLYRSVDLYLKAHPWIPEWERERMCGMMEYQKLTLEACTHAAQNDRLPLRAVVQVLFFEQLQLRHEIAGTRPDAVEEESTTMTTWKRAVRENEVLRVDMESMRTRVHELERECSTMKKVMTTKMDAPLPLPLPQPRGGWSRRFGCKFKTQVCDSQESTVVEARKKGTAITNHRTIRQVV